MIKLCNVLVGLLISRSLLNDVVCRPFHTLQTEAINNFIFCKIHSVVVYNIRFNINAAVNHNKFYQSCQYIQNDSVALTVFTHLIHEFKTQNNDSPWSLARPGRKHVRDARDFNNIETRAVESPPPPSRQGAEGKSHHSDRNISLFPSWSC